MGWCGESLIRRGAAAALIGATLMAASIGFILTERQSPFASSIFQSPPFMPAAH
jgi:hypothetical protein